MNYLRQSLYLIILLPLLAKTQVENSNKVSDKLEKEIVHKPSSIQWIQGLTWRQVKEKAKAENKYIFFDCYTTWCGPCKMMDNQIYSNDSVGDYFNRNFISVRVQMDKSKEDDQNVKSWYDDADRINRDFRIEGYPTYIFFSPEGIIVHKDMGAILDVKKFLAIAQTAIMPGRIYQDPYLEYDRLVAEYQQGKIQYDKLPFMITTSSKLNDTILRYQLVKTHVDFVIRLQPKERYTKENIEFWASFVLGSKTRIFQFFYKDGDIIDRVMGKKGYAAKVADQTIWNEAVLPFLVEQAAGTGIEMTGMYLTGLGLKPDYSEADWRKLKKIIHLKFNKEYVKRNVLAAKIEWYVRHRNFVATTKYRLMQFAEYPPDINKDAGMINDFCWNAFIHVIDKTILNETIKWAKKVVETYPNLGMVIDTYANLLYKVGRKEEAIQWQEKAAKLALTDKSIQDALKKMKLGERTYITQGAIWE